MIIIADADQAMSEKRR